MLRFALVPWLFLTALAVADPPPNAPPNLPPDASPDKSAFTLFHPTPPDQLRGMDTDRPNETNSPHTVDAGHLQIEAGAFDYAFDRVHARGADARVDAYAFGQFNFRLGVLNNLELNVSFDSFDLIRTRDFQSRSTDHANGFGDTTVGGKLNLCGNDGPADQDVPGAFAIAVQPQITFPTSPGDVGDGHVDETLLIPMVVNLPAKFHLDVQPGIAHQRSIDNTGDATVALGAIAVDRVFFEKLDPYVEYAGFFTDEHHTQPVETFDVGAIYQLSDRLTVDLGLVFGLNRSSNTVEVLSGASYRF